MLLLRLDNVFTPTLRPTLYRVDARHLIHTRFLSQNKVRRYGL
jgi:hypothetical protein